MKRSKTMKMGARLAAFGLTALMAGAAASPAVSHKEAEAADGSGRDFH